MAFFPKSGYFLLIFQKKGGPPSLVTGLNNHAENNILKARKSETKIHRGNKKTFINK